MKCWVRDFKIRVPEGWHLVMSSLRDSDLLQRCPAFHAGLSPCAPPAHSLPGMPGTRVKNFLIASGGDVHTCPPAPSTALNRSPAVFFRNGRAFIIAASNTCVGGCSLQYSSNSFASNKVSASISPFVHPVPVMIWPKRRGQSAIRLIRRLADLPPELRSGPSLIRRL